MNHRNAGKLAASMWHWDGEPREPSEPIQTTASCSDKRVQLESLVWIFEDQTNAYFHIPTGITGLNLWKQTIAPLNLWNHWKHWLKKTDFKETCLASLIPGCCLANSVAAMTYILPSGDLAMAAVAPLITYQGIVPSSGAWPATLFEDSTQFKTRDAQIHSSLQRIYKSNGTSIWIYE